MSGGNLSLALSFSMAMVSARLLRTLPCCGIGVEWKDRRRLRGFRCSAISVEAPVAGISGIRWGSSKLQGARSEMEDEVVLRSDGLSGFSFAAVLDGHAGFSCVEFLREELYKECVTAMQGGLLLTNNNFGVVREAIEKVFANVDARLSIWLEQTGKDIESGATATVMFVRNDALIISHVGDSCVVISRRGKAEMLTNPHRPYGNNRVSLEEIKRVRAAGGWIVDGRICGDLAISRTFGDIRYKSKKNEFVLHNFFPLQLFCRMLMKGVKQGRWNDKFVSRIQFKADIVTSSPDISQIELSSDVEFVLLASDGLWDYMKSSEAVSFVRDQLRQHGDVQIACEALARAALDRHSQDNISIIIADLGRTDWQNLPVQGPNYPYEITQAFATVGVVFLGIWLSSFLGI
ncbi:hypothetical protein ZIOFF_025267 [Zingiber officinale]|uniref:protein-serine/threonine phosphatase n=1 Tax=Zingiber officinale TaxID=94328 RepID=A0A8J5LGV6_ZINOF|nr:hypothetical protein ZIOFF_025267 [Zingiber officinale]